MPDHPATDKIAENVWLRLIARGAMAIGLPVLGYVLTGRSP